MTTISSSEKFYSNLDCFKKIVDNSYDEILVITGDGDIVYTNEACQNQYGLTPTELIGKNVYEFPTIQNWNPRIRPLILKTKSRITIIQTSELGKKILTTGNPILDNDGNIEYIIYNVRNINETEGLKKELETTQKMLEKYKTENKFLRKNEQKIKDFICKSNSLKDILDLIQHIVEIDSTVLLLGESGTGKSVLAKYIHNHSNRKNGPFITINCAALPDSLLESELFGYSEGAFTGANKSGKLGLIELANHGTLFLDEIGEIPLNVQVKLLRFIQENKFYSIGGRQEKTVDCRIIAATNRNLEQLVQSGKFREDLYYRLNVLEIKIPSLRDRSEDIITLIYHFLEKFEQKYHTLNHTFSIDCLNVLTQYSWPGNIRQLENLIERLVITVQEETIKTCHLPAAFTETLSPKDSLQIPLFSSFEETLQEAEKQIITKAYKEYDSGIQIAKALKISQSKASRLLRKYCK